MSRLFHSTDQQITEENTAVLVAGVKQELFACLVRNQPKKVTDFVFEAAAIEKTLEILTRQCDRPVNAVVMETIGDGA